MRGQPAKADARNAFSGRSVARHAVRGVDFHQGRSCPPAACAALRARRAAAIAGIV